MSSQSSHGSLIALGALSAAVAAFAAYQYATAPSPLTSSALDAVPEATFLVAEVDVDALRASPAIRNLAEGRGGDVVGVARLRAACGFDPLERTHTLVVAIPEADLPGEIGIAARVDVARADLTRCTEALSLDGGGKRTARREGDFAILDGERERDPSYAYHPSGLLLVAGRQWLTEMMASAGGAKPRVASHEGHVRLREALVGKGAPKPALVMTAVLPEGVRQKMRNDLGHEASDSEQQAQMRAVLGVTGAGLALTLAAPGSDAAVRVELTCDEESSCERVESMIQKQRLELSQDVRVRMLGLGALVDAVEVSGHGKSLTVTSRVAMDAIGAAIGRALRFARPRTEPRADPRAEPPRDLRAALERIEARRDGGAPTSAEPRGDGGLGAAKPTLSRERSGASDGSAPPP